MTVARIREKYRELTVPLVSHFELLRMISQVAYSCCEAASASTACLDKKPPKTFRQPVVKQRASLFLKRVRLPPVCCKYGVGQSARSICSKDLGKSCPAPMVKALDIEGLIRQGCW